jgi:hypothetical protein
MQAVGGLDTMATYVKTVVIGSVMGGLHVPAVKVDAAVNEALDRLQREGARVLDVKYAFDTMPSGGIVSTYLIIYDAAHEIA